MLAVENTLRVLKSEKLLYSVIWDPSGSSEGILLTAKGISGYAILDRKVSILRAMRIDEAQATTLEPGRSSKPLVTMDVGAKNVQISWMETPSGWKSDQHTRDVEEVLYILSGKCAITSEKERIEATAGTIIFVPPGEKHQHENIGTQTFSQLVIFAPPLKR